MAAAFGWGTLAASSLVIGALVALRFSIGLRTIGLTIYEGGAVGAAYLAAVFISTLPESVSSTSGLASGGWAKSRILWMWIAIAVVSGLASLAGYALFQDSAPGTVAFVLAFAAGAILTMLAQTMMPEAWDADLFFQLTITMALTVGIAALVAGLLRLGFLASSSRSR